MTYLIKNIRGLYISEIVFFLVTFFLTIFLYRSNQFKDGILGDLSHNWKLSPIKKISRGSSEDNNENKNLGFYKKEKKPINKWRNTELKIETMDSKYTYYNVYSERENTNNKKLCGTDNEGNDLYFPLDVDCPLNYLEIKDENESFYCKNPIKLTNNKYLHYSNQYTEGKIIVELQISQHYPCPNNDYDNNFCPVLEFCDKKIKKGCNIANYLKDKYIYEDLDYDLASNAIKYIDDKSNILNDDYLSDIDSTGLIKNSDIKEKISTDGNYFAYNSNNEKIFILYKRSWIGYYNSEEEKEDFRESKSKLKNFTHMRRFCRRKNRALLAFSILILFSIIAKYILIYFFKTLDFLVYFDFFIIICLFINWLFNSISISRYNSFKSVFFFKYSIFNYFNHNEYNITKIEISLLFFNLVFFILEFVLFFYDFSQTENYLIECWNKNKDVDKKTTESEKKGTEVNENSNTSKDINLPEISRLEILETEKTKNMTKLELIKYFHDKLNNFNKLPIIQEDNNEDNESSQNIEYNIEQSIISTNQNVYNYITEETLTNNNNNSNNINNINTELILKENNFSHVISNIAQQNEHNTPHGNFGLIRTFNYKGKEFALKIPKLKDNLNTQIIIKNIVEIKQLENEINLLKEFNHKNIVKFYKKKIIENQIPCMVLENCEGGDLKKVLEKKPTNEFKKKMMKQLAEALIYLHEKGYVHSDLKCDNILLDKPYNEQNYPNLKLADFGCSVKIGEKYNNGSILFRAIEILKNFDSKVTDKIDVYSFASTCYQIIKEKVPFDGNKNEFLKKIIPDVNDLNCSEQMKNLLKECWNENPENRPDMKTILNILNQINIF